MKLADLLVPPEIVPELRYGLLVSMGHAAERLSVLTLPGWLLHLPSYESSLWAIDATRSLLQQVGEVAPKTNLSVSLDEGEYPFLLYCVLRSRHELLQRLRQDVTIATGMQHEFPDEDALGRYVASLGQRLDGGQEQREERRRLVGSNTLR